MTPERPPGNRTEQGRFRPGASGNPNGRPKRLGELEAEIREAHGAGALEVLEKLRDLALAGDVQASRVYLDRVLGPARVPVDPLPAPAPGGDATDPDVVLGKLVELVDQQATALQAKAAAEGLTADDASSIARAMRDLTKLVLGARRQIIDEKLRKLTDEGLDAVEEAGAIGLPTS